MANNSRNSNKGGFWKKLFGNAAQDEILTSSTLARQQNDAPLDDETAAVDTAEDKANDSLWQQDGLQAELSADDFPAADEPQDQFAGELAARDKAIHELEKEIIVLEEKAGLQQRHAVEVLAALAEAENQYNAANAAANQAAEAASAVKAEQDQRFAAAEQENEALIAAAEQQVAALREALAQERGELAEPLSRINNVAQNLAAEQAERQAKEQEKLAAIGRQLTLLEEYAHNARCEQDAAQDKIAALQSSVQRAQTEYDRAAQELSALEYRLQVNNFDGKLAALADDDRQTQERINSELSDNETRFEQQLQEAEAQYQQLAEDITRQKDAIAAASAQASAANQAEMEAQSQLQRLQAEKQTVIAEADAQLEMIAARVESARQDVEAKKNAYAEAQQQVQQSTSISVRANAQAAAAREKADKAVIEKADAATAAEMAQKLKSDATVARGNTDEASSLLLSRAEMVLLNTSEKALRLLEEKTSLAEIAQQEAARLRSEADVAAAEAKRAAGVADKMISLWLASEENLVKVTAAAEENKRQVEERTAALAEQYDRNIAAAQQTAGEQQQAAQAAVDAGEQAQQQLAACEDEYNRLAQQIEDLKNDYAVGKKQLEQELADSIAAAQQQIASCENDQRLLQTKIADKRTFAADKEQRLAALTDELQHEEENYRSLAAASAQKIACYQDELIQLQGGHQQTLDEMQATIGDTLAYLASCRSKAERLSSNIARLEKELSLAQADTERAEETSVDRLMQARKSAEREIAAAQQASSEARALAHEQYARLQDARSDAETQVKAAVDATVARLEALSRVSCQYVEKEIFALDNQIQVAEEKMLAAKAALADAQSVFQDLEQAASGLTEEKAQLAAEYESKYLDLAEQKDAEIALLDQELAFLAQVEQECQQSLNAANTAMDKIVNEYSAAQDRLHACMAEKERLSAESTEQLAALDEEYRIAMEGDGQEIPVLRKVFEEAKQKRDQAIAAFGKADSQWREQVETTSALRNEELTYKQDSANQLAALKAENAARLQAVQDAVAAAKAHKQELDAAYAKAQAYSDTNDASKQEAEQRWQQIVAEEQQQQELVDGELQKINEHLQLLKEDADEKQQKYRATSAIVKNSQQLMKDAEESFALAKNAFAKAEAELNTAEAAYKTSAALADQAAQSYQSVDNETAAILKRASEELVIAADNAAVFVEEKKKDYQQAQEALQTAKRDFDNMTQTVGEAPELADAEKAAWLKADEEYKRYQEKADQRIPAIKQEFADFLAERAATKAAARSTVDKCVSEGEDTRRQLETISTQLMETLAEIARLTAEQQSLENSIIEQEAQIEGDNERTVQAKKAARENGEELAQRLEMVMLQRKEDRDSALEHFEQAKADYQQACEKADSHYQADKADIDQRLAKMIHNAENANTIFKSIAELRKKAADELAAAQERYQTTIGSKEQALAAKAKLIEKKNAELHELSEVKLRILSNNAMARITAEAQADRANKEYLRNKSLFEEADKAWQDLLQQRESAQQRLAEIKKDGENAVAAAKENILYMTKDAAF